MAQWMWQFSGFTHESKVQDIEHSLRSAITTCKALPEAERAGKLKAIRHLSEKLLAVRLKALRARISALTGPQSRNFDDTKVAHLRIREQELEGQSPEDILKEFGI